MIWAIKEFRKKGLPKDRWTYFETNQYLQECFREFLPAMETVGQVLERMWYEYKLVVRETEIECFMIYMVMLKLYILQNLPSDDLRNEVKRMLSEDILEKYRPLLPTDEYELLASDIKALHLD